jgi:rubrerythrin
MRVVIEKDGRIALNDFSAVQAYKIAIRMEENGIAFYRGLLAKVKDEDARHEIDFLIEQEENHRKTFQGLLDKEKQASGDGFEEDDIVDYLNAKVFDASVEKEKARRMDHRHTAMEEALDYERRTIVFYDGCLRQTKDPQAQAALRAVLEEEKKHLAKFAELLRIKCINSEKGCLL